jgi:hypothetical protein
MPPKAAVGAKPAEKKEEGKEGAEKKEEGAEPGKEGAEKGEEGAEPGKEGAEKGEEGAEKGEAPIPGQNPETGKCEGEDSCAGNNIADSFKDPGRLMDGAKKSLDDGVKNGINHIMTSLTNPAKCATMVVGSVPAVIQGIGKSISGAFNDISLSINNTFDTIHLQGFDGMFGPFKIAHAMFMLKLQGIINDIALGSEAEKILSDPNLTAKILFDKLVYRSKMYKLAIKDAEFRGVFKVWIADYVNTLLNALKIAQPEVDRINAEIKAIIEGMGDNIGESLGHAITNVIASAVSALPAVGGIVSAVKSADQLGQEIINACKPPIAKGAGIIMPIVNQFNKEKSRFACEGEKLKRKIQPPLDRIEAKMNALSQKIENKMASVSAKIDNKISKTAAKIDKKMSQSGGATMTKRENRRKIKNTTKRIHYLLKRFTCRRQRKLNYTRRLNDTRC